MEAFLSSFGYLFLFVIGVCFLVIIVTATGLFVKSILTDYGNPFKW